MKEGGRLAREKRWLVGVEELWERVGMPVRSQCTSKILSKIILKF